MSPNWDVFHSDRLEVERGLSSDDVRRGLAEGKILDDDLLRPAGTPAAWTPISDIEEFRAAVPGIPLMAELVDDAPPMAEFVDEPGMEFVDLADEAILPEVAPSRIPTPVPVFEGDEESDPLEEDEDAAEFTFTRSASDTIEELDLAAMVDVAFQLVLFFLVTAQTILYKSLEVPKPNTDAPPEAAVQGRGKSLEDLKANFILVEIDSSGGMKIDREPLADGISLESLADRLRAARKDTDRSAMLLTADFSTPHRNAVLAYDAANEIGLRIAIAKPTGSAAEGEIPMPVKRNNGPGF